MFHIVDKSWNYFVEPWNRWSNAGVASFYVEAAIHIARVSHTILLARHGSHAELGVSLSGRSEIALNDAGRAEARRLADRLRTVRLAAIHSSPRRRAVETASVVAADQHIGVEIVPALDELDFGEWSGRTFDALANEPGWQNWNRARGSAATPSGETMASATARAVRHIETIKENGPVLCVSHCDIIRGVAAHYLGLSADRLLSFDCDPASLTTLALYEGGGRVVSLNERAA